MPILLQMNARTKVLKELVSESRYVVDPAAVAEAIVARSAALRLLPDVTFRSDAAAPADTRVRSFRPHRAARSFRLSGGERRPPHGADDASDPAHAR